MRIGISKGYADSNPVLSGSQSGMVKGCVSKSIMFGMFWMPTYTINPLTLLQEGVPKYMSDSHFLIRFPTLDINSRTGSKSGCISFAVVT